ncbi:MAG TPA: hypothetical protein VFA04_16860 [Bryobacteraceae bacterium]|nr:hypothetical protein [Bryobacteraceae bacterium]
MSVRFLCNTFTVLAAALFLSACSGSPEMNAAKATVEQAKPQPTPPPEPVAALTAFYEMYRPARTWAPDLLPLSLAANDLPGMKATGGKAGLWTAVFVSPGRREARTYYYAVMDSPLAPKGATARAVQAWGGPTRDNHPFQNTEIMVNSDAAWNTAATKAAAWLKKHPDKPVMLQLVASARFPSPVWFIMWGDKKDGYAAFINATTGDPMSGK